MVRPMRAIQVLLAATALVLIGAVEAAASARQLAAQAGRGRPTLSGEGAALTLAGLALSVAVYLVLGRAVGRSSGHERTAVAEGVASGILAGAVGGSLRALAVSDYLGEQVARFGLPAELTFASLAVFVAGAIVASAIGGGALTWLGFRLSSRSPRPPP